MVGQQAAEFAGHAIPTPQGPLSTENYVVEIGMYGPPEMRLQLSFTDFTLRINGAKKTIEAQHSETVAQSVKDPNWVPPEKQDKSKSFNVGGGGASTESKGPVKVPLEVQRGMAQRVRKRPWQKAIVFFRRRDCCISGTPARSKTYIRSS